MQTADLQFVLRNCFTPEALRAFMASLPVLEDPYSAAADSILNEDEDGLSVVDELDRASLKQRRKIRSMSAKDLRGGLAFEFMEPGRALGQTVWALLRDDRLSAHAMAGELISSFSDELKDEKSAVDAEIEDAPIAVEEMLSDLSSPEPDHANGDDPIPFPEKERTEAPPADLPVSVSKSEQDVLTEDDISREVDSLIESLKDDTDIESDNEIVVGPGDLIEEEPAVEEFVETDDDEPMISDLTDDDLKRIEDESFGEDADDGLGEDSDDEEFDFSSLEPEGEPDTDEEAIKTLEDVDSLIASFGASDDDDDDYELVTDSDDDDEDDDDLGGLFGQDEDDEARVSLGGVPIPLSALQRACERVFNEPVELVVDETLTRDDKIVVVGKNCGVRVLHGPSCAVPPPDEEFVRGDAPVIASCESLQEALSTIYGEPVEIVPDVNLLSRGVVVFAGRSTGLAVYEHPRLQVPLEGVEPVEPAASQTDALYQRIDELEARLAQIENAAAAAPASAPAPVDEPEPEPEPEPEEDLEESVSREAMNLDEIEPEELSPVTEDIDDDELMAAISQQEDDSDEDDEFDMGALTATVDAENEAETDAEDEGGEPEESGEDSSVGDALDLDDLEGLLGGDEASAEEDEDDDDDSDAAVAEDETAEDDDDGIDLGDLDLDELGLSQGEESEAAAEDDAEAEDDSTGDDDDGLGDLDLESLGDEIDIDLGEDTAEDDDSGEEDGSDAIGDALDLDVLSELEGDSEGGFTPQKVLNGEKILLLGGEDDHSDDYTRVVEELGGSCEWHGSLSEMGTEEINELVDQSDVIVSLTADALSDPGILSAASYAQENNKRFFEHHSANPVSVQKQMAKWVEDGQI